MDVALWIVSTGYPRLIEGRKLCKFKWAFVLFRGGGLKWLLGWLWARFQEEDLTNLQNCRNGPKKVPQSSHLSVGRDLIAIWAMEGDFYNGASLRWHSMILDDI